MIPPCTGHSGDDSILTDSVEPQTWWLISTCEAGSAHLGLMALTLNHSGRVITYSLNHTDPLKYRNPKNYYREKPCIQTLTCAPWINSLNWITRYDDKAIAHELSDSLLSSFSWMFWFNGKLIELDFQSNIRTNSLTSRCVNKFCLVNTSARTRLSSNFRAICLLVYF